MGIEAIFQRENWVVPFHFWSVALFTLGCMVGSFLNVCIHRMPRDMSIVRPASHCPACGYAIPWYLNIPLITWLWLGGKCANCRGRISARYVLVELGTGLAFLGSWLWLGRDQPWVALVYCLLLSGFIVATFIDFEHFIIPDGITIGGMVAGFLCSFMVPGLHGETHAALAMKKSLIGMAVGAGLIYLILRGGKLLFGRHNVALPPDSRIVFTEASLVLPEEELPYEEVFYRKTDTIQLEAKRLELIDRCFWSVRVRLRPDRLEIGEESFDPETVPYMEVVTDRIVLPREAMGLGDVKFMGAIGAFLGWPATLFALLVSSMVGGGVGLILILCRRREWSCRIPYGPYIALGAVIWMFGGEQWVAWWLSGAWVSLPPELAP